MTKVTVTEFNEIIYAAVKKIEICCMPPKRKKIDKNMRGILNWRSKSLKQVVMVGGRYQY